MYINNFIIEVTRQCNMSCEHCLRGNAQNKNIDCKFIDSFLSQCDSIGSVTFTGGEPSLNVKSIDYFLQRAKELNISIGGFYIATNGLKITEEFVLACLRLYSYCDDKETCTVHVSNDVFHANEGSYNTELLDGLSFFHRKFDQESYDYDGFKYLLNEGRAKENFNISRTARTSSITTQEDFEDAEVVLNCNGQIINGCDWSYANQRKHIICSVDKLTEYYKLLSE